MFLALIMIVVCLAAAAFCIDVAYMQLVQTQLRTATDGLERATQFASSGTYSLRFRTPAYKKGMEQWPAFEAKPSLRDWRGYDRLVIDAVNPGGKAPFLSFICSDSKVPFRDDAVRGKTSSSHRIGSVALIERSVAAHDFPSGRSEDSGECPHSGTGCSQQDCRRLLCDVCCHQVLDVESCRRLTDWMRLLRRINRHRAPAANPQLRLPETENRSRRCIRFPECY